MILDEGVKIIIAWNIKENYVEWCQVMYILTDFESAGRPFESDRARHLQVQNASCKINNAKLAVLSNLIG